MDESTHNQKDRRARLETIIRAGVSKEALQALEEYFEMDKCTFIFRDAYGQPLAPDYNTYVLIAAQRDGNREVINLIKNLHQSK